MKRPIRLALLWGCMTFLGGALTLLAMVGGDSFVLPATNLRLPAAILVYASLAVMGLGLLSILFPPRFAMALASATWCMWLLFFFSQHEERRGERTISLAGQDNRVHVSPGHWFEPWLDSDPRYGTSGPPNAKRRYVNPDFDLVMHFDEEGWRVVQAQPPEMPLGEIWFLGCSFTFGFGVEDRESFPAILGTEAWSRYRIRNYAHCSWGTVNAYLVLREKLATRPAPVGVFYGWISHHMVRNYLRNSPWRRGTDTTFPHFELVDGELEFRGIARPEISNLPDGPELDQKEFDLSVKLIEEMDRMCKEKGVPFFLMTLENGDKVARHFLSEEAISCIDVGAAIPLERLPHDGHPNRFWHRNVARLLAGDPRIRARTGNDDLYQPSAVITSLLHWTLTNDSASGFFASIVPADGIGNKIRVQNVRLPKADPWKIGVARGNFAIQKGKPYELRFLARADAPRPMRISLTKEFPPWNGLGLSQTIELSPQSKEWRFPFVGARSEPRASLQFWMGESDVPLELENVLLLEDGRDLLAPSD